MVNEENSVRPVAERHKTDMKLEADSSVLDACDLCRSQVSCNHVHVCVGLFICLSCCTELVSSPWVELIALFRTPLINSGILSCQTKTCLVWPTPRHSVFECGYLLFRHNHRHVPDSSGVCRLIMTGNKWLSWGLKREKVLGTFQPLLNHLKPHVQPN